MRLNRSAASLIAAAMLIATTACGGDSNASSDGGSNVPGPVVVTTPDRPTAAPNDPTKCKSLEGCFDQDGMNELYDEIIRNLRVFLKETYKDIGEPKWLYTAAGDEGTSSCDDRVARDTDLAYCRADWSVYVGLKALWDLYSKFGDAAAFVPIAHEVGHFVQQVAGVPNLQGRAGIPQENQADCFAGAFFLWAQGKGYVEPDDVNEMGETLVAAGERENVKRSHGTPEERLNSFLMGYKGGVAACNAFYPNNPLIS